MVSYQYLNDIPEGTTYTLDNNFIYVCSKPVTVKGKILSNSQNIILIINGPYDADIKKRSYLWIAPEGSLEANQTLYIYGVTKVGENDYVFDSNANNGGFIVSGGTQDYISEHPYLKQFPARKVNNSPIPKILGDLYLNNLGSNVVYNENNVSYCSTYNAYIGLVEEEIENYNLKCFNLLNRNSIMFFNSKFTFNNLYALAFDSVRALCINDASYIKFKTSINVLNQFLNRANNVMGLTRSKLEILSGCRVGLNAVFLNSYNNEETLIISGPDEYIFKNLVFEEFYIRGTLNSNGCIFSS